jgi:hypothetical protein
MQPDNNNSSQQQQQRQQQQQQPAHNVTVNLLTVYVCVRAPRGNQRCVAPAPTQQTSAAAAAAAAPDKRNTHAVTAACIRKQQHITHHKCTRVGSQTESVPLSPAPAQHPPAAA